MIPTQPTAVPSRLLAQASRFPDATVLAAWQQALARRGQRPPGSPEHDGYVHDLADRLTAMGVREVRLEAVPSTGSEDEPVAFNLVGLIPGASDELVALHGVTDGPGDGDPRDHQGAEVVMAMAHYLAGVPRTELPRGILVLLTSERGLMAFAQRHEEDLVPRVATTLHLSGHSATGTSMRHQVISLTEAVLELADTSWTRLRSTGRLAAAS